MRFHFDGFVLDTDLGVLQGPEGEVRLRPKAYGLLEMLAARAPAVLARDEILDCIWGTDHLGETSVAGAVSELRRALGDDPREPRIIETVHRRGYRFIAPLVSEEEPPREAVRFRSEIQQEEEAYPSAVEPQGLPDPPLPRPLPRRWARWKAQALSFALGGLAMLAIGMEGSPGGEASRSTPSSPFRHRIVVLPFEQQGNGEQGRWLSAGLPYLTAWKIDRDPRVYVYPFHRAEAMVEDLPQLVGAADPPLEEVESYLKADWLLRGSVEESPEGGVRARLELYSVDGSQEPRFWEERLEHTDVVGATRRWADRILQRVVPRYPPIHSRLGRFGSTPEALEKFFTARDLAPEDPGRAMELMDQVAELTPDQPPLLFARGWILLEQGRLAEAQVHALRGSRITRDRRLKVIFLSTLGRSEEARRLLQSLPEKLSSDPELWLESLRALSFTGQQATVLAWLDAMPPELRNSWLEAELGLLEAEAASILGDPRRAARARDRATSAARRRGHHGTYALASDSLAGL